MTAFILRPPRPDECTALTALCLASKAHWGYDAAFMAACVAELTVRPADLAADRYCVTECAGTILGVAALSADGNRGRIERMFVAPEVIGTGIGRALMDWLIGEARGLGLAAIDIDADPGAVGFYERMGARRVGEAPSGSMPGRMLPALVMDLKN
jgi:GNAT superfamily N-acetyltransferase